MVQSTAAAWRAMTLAASCVSLMFPPSGVAAQEFNCATYANAAVAQSKQNKMLGCGFTGNRWLNDFQAHFDWCNAPTRTVAQAAAEADGRTAALAECANRSKILRLDDSVCADYAAKAVAAARAAASKGCNFSGNRWLDDYSAHLKWCNTAPLAARNAEESARDIQLKVCLTLLSK